jgi:hypothetical protein
VKLRNFEKISLWLEFLWLITKVKISVINHENFLRCLVFDEKAIVNGLESCFPAVHMTKKFCFAGNLVVLKISEKIL